MLQLENLSSPVMVLNKQMLVLFIPWGVDFEKELSIDLTAIAPESTGIEHQI